MASTTNQNQATALDLLMALDSATKRTPGTVRVAASPSNRAARTTGVVTSARENGLYVLQAETVLDGWTRVNHGKVTADVTPEQVARMIEQRAKAARAKAVAGIEHDPDYVNLKVIGSQSLKPSPDARLGGRFYILDASAVAKIDDAHFASMVDDVSENVAIALSAARPQ